MKANDYDPKPSKSPESRGAFGAGHRVGGRAGGHVPSNMLRPPQARCSWVQRVPRTEYYSYGRVNRVAPAAREPQVFCSDDSGLCGGEWEVSRRGTRSRGSEGAPGGSGELVGAVSGQVADARYRDPIRTQSGAPESWPGR